MNSMEHYGEFTVYMGFCSGVWLCILRGGQIKLKGNQGSCSETDASILSNVSSRSASTYESARLKSALDNISQHNPILV